MLAAHPRRARAGAADRPVRPQRGDYRHVRVALIAAIKIEPRRTLTGTVSG